MSSNSGSNYVLQNNFSRNGKERKKVYYQLVSGMKAKDYLSLIPSQQSNFSIPNFLSVKQSVQFSLVAQSCLTVCDPVDCSTPGFPVHHKLLEPVQTQVHQVGDAIQPSHPLLSPSLPAFSLSQHQGSRSFSSESVLHITWPKYGVSASASGLISFSIDWFDLFAVQESLKSLLQHHSSKASILWRSAFL